jgi:hypothetical protein
MTIQSKFSALDEVKDEYDILLHSCLSAKGGITQSQALSPSHMIETLRSSQDSFPRDLQVPLPLSETYSWQKVVLNSHN